MNQNFQSRAEPRSGQSGNLIYGHLSPINTGIIQVLSVLAGDPAYAELRLRHVPQIVRVMQSGAYFAAVQDGVCCGVVLFVRISGATARRCIAEARLPNGDELSDAGDSLCMTAIAGHQIKALAREFSKHHAGSIILFERHFRDDAERPAQFGWIDRVGRIRGSALED